MASRTKTSTKVADVKRVDAGPETKVTDVKQVDAGPDIHQMVRSIGANPDPARGIYTSDQVDDHLRNWLEQGYRLHTAAVTYLSPGPVGTGMIVEEPRWDVFYVLVKD